MTFPRTFLGTVGAIILAYLFLAHFTGATHILSAGSSAFNSGVKTLQGR